MTSVEAAEKKSLKVLITGFGPFRNIKSNPSWLATKPLDNQTLKFTKPAQAHAPKSHPVEIEAHVSALEVPVTYSAVLSTVPPLHLSKQYDVILHVGVGLAGGLEIERLAHKTGYNEPDAAGRRFKRGFGPGFEEFGEELSRGVDADEVVRHLKSKGLEYTSPSNDPGRYLCDFIYFCSLACAKKEGSKVKVLFMHVPPVGSPYQVEDMTKAVKGIIEYFALHT
ncbi:hypothetical protein FRC11_005561 [Ceratobasidium sp. 423]|nr:hypothetical protein FRC11_005561 [Ceratobasidium sp. 423]